MEYMFMPLRRYADFSGRSRRREYWMFMLFVLAVEMLLYALLIAAAMGSGGEMNAAVTVPLLLLILFALAIFIPSVAVTVRRFHDQERSGATALLMLVPLVGPLVVLVFMSLEGTPGPNRYGPDPKAGEGGAAGA